MYLKHYLQEEMIHFTIGNMISYVLLIAILGKMKSHLNNWYKRMISRKKKRIIEAHIDDNMSDNFIPSFSFSIIIIYCNSYQINGYVL